MVRAAEPCAELIESSSELKLLAVVSALDLRLPVGATSAWWQLLKGLYEVGAHVVATPYAGEAVESPWWRAAENPCRREAHLFLGLKALVNRLAPGRQASPSRLTTALARRAVLPRWRRHLIGLLEVERDIDAVLVVNVPASHFAGLPSLLRSRFSVPVFYLDGDMPMSLPAFGGYASGVRGYDGVNLSEYDAVITNSRAVEPELLGMGARRVHTLHFAADPDLFSPTGVEQDIDVFFYAYGAEEREAAIEHMVAAPSRELGARFVVAGARLSVDLGRARLIPPVLTSGLREWAGRSRLNLNIVRRAHAIHRSSSCMRLFELAAMGCCIVSNPIAGLEEWLEPGVEVAVAPEREACAPLYRSLLADAGARRAMGEAARRRVLAEHTYRHRALTLLSLLGSPAAP